MSASSTSSWSQKVHPEQTSSGIRVVEAENDFPMERIDLIRIGSAHVVVRDDEMADVAAEVLRSLMRQINAQFDPSAADEPVEIVAK